MERRRQLLALACALALALAPAAPATQARAAAQAEAADPSELPRPADAAELFALFAASPGLEAEFEEEKHLALLAAPLRSRGRLYFLPPGRLARVIESPEPATVLVTPTELRATSRDGEERVDLAASPDLRAFVTSLAQVLAGARDGLAELWAIDYRPAPDDARAWSLVLAPRADVAGREALRGMVERLTLAGRGRSVATVEVLEPSGDRTLTRILRADPLREFTAEERERLFGIARAGE